MNEQRSFIRKVGYVCAVAVLLLPLSYLSQPATSESSGGQLAQFRSAHNLSQANLGEIDPAGETMKLATLGLRGVAANLLWDKANYYKKVEDWTSLSATLEQITKLQPNYVSVWQFQGWNMAYNVAVEFDDYHDRYQWVIKGINFLKQGTRYNAREPRLIWDIGWDISSKIGTADEKVLYRKMFREDDDFHRADDPTRGRSQRDNWLVGAWWFEKAEKLLDQGVPFKGSSPTGEGKSPLTFYANRPMCEINYAKALEEDGTFGEVAKLAWSKAANAWTDYGNRDLPTTYNTAIRLNDQERLQQRANEEVVELEKLTSGVREKIRDERLAKLPPDKRKLAETPRQDRSPDQISAGVMIDAEINPTPFDVAEKAPEKVRLHALQLAKAAQEDQQVAFIIERDREVVNFVYWHGRCEMERDDETLSARKGIHQAEQTFKNADLKGAGKLFDEGFQHWHNVLEKFPQMAAETTFITELYDSIDRYGYYLTQLDDRIKDDFVLKDLIIQAQKMHVSMEGKKYIPTDLKPAETKSPAAEGDKNQPPAADADKPTGAEKPAAGEKPAGEKPPGNEKPAPVDNPASSQTPAKAEQPAPADKPTTSAPPANSAAPAKSDQGTSSNKPAVGDKPAANDKQPPSP